MAASTQALLLRLEYKPGTALATVVKIRRTIDERQWPPAIQYCAKSAIAGAKRDE